MRRKAKWYRGQRSHEYKQNWLEPAVILMITVDLDGTRWYQ